MALKDTLPDSLSPSLCCLDPDKANGRGRGGKSRARLWARKIMDMCRGRQYKEDSEDKRGKKKAEEVVAWETVNPFLSPYSTRQLDGTGTERGLFRVYFMMIMPCLMMMINDLVPFIMIIPCLMIIFNDMVNFMMIMLRLRIMMINNDMVNLIMIMPFNYDNF